MFQYPYTWVIQCSVGEVIISEPGCYISALEHIRMLILNVYVSLACINTISKYGHACLGDLVRCILSFTFWAQELYI